MIEENGTIHIKNTHGGLTTSFRPRFTSPVKVDRRMTPPISLAGGKLRSWTRGARPGARVVYHFGNLAIDRARTVDGAVEGPLAPGAAFADRLGEEAYLLYEQGYLLLTQIAAKAKDGRALPATYHYVAIRTNKKYEDPKANA